MLGSFFDHFFVNFSCCFFDRFWVVLGCQNGAFLETEIDQHATYEFLIFIDFIYCVFHYFGALEGLMLVLYPFFFRIVFCIDFWSIWGSFWEALGGPNRSILASIF